MYGKQQEVMSAFTCVRMILDKLVGWENHKGSFKAKGNQDLIGIDVSSEDNEYEAEDSTEYT
jgi:CobQ-like glutamine amidotransferase family enzyme